MNTQNTVSSATAAHLKSLEAIANRLRRHSLISTSRAGSGHPSTCLSCAELMSALFFHNLRFEVSDPRNPRNDRVVLSKGHAAPIFWAAWAEAGAFPVDLLLTMRDIDSDLEGHPTPRCAWADVASGSLGQGLSMGVGMALAARLDGTNNTTYVLLGDGELAEGSVWEAAMLASHRKLDNLVAILDINRFGQSQTTMYEHELEVYRRRFAAFGWETRVIDGHDMEQVVEALEEAREYRGSPFALVARTLKGKGVSFMEDRGGWHGKPVPKGEMLDRALSEIGQELELTERLEIPPPLDPPPTAARPAPMSAPGLPADSEIATRFAYGTGLAKLGSQHSQVVVLDGDTKNSTYSQEFLKVHPERFVECFIAEQNMVGVAVGMAVLNKVPFASTFACFLSRAYDQIRMAGISRANLKLCGSHCGVSIGPDGPSQMGLEDISMMRAIAGSTVLYPSDAVSAERMVELAAHTPGIVYIRTTRPTTPLLYSDATEFRVGGSHTIRRSDRDQVTLVSAGLTLHQALAAADTLSEEGIRARVIDLYCVKPVDEATLREAVAETGSLITIEDHYPEGGLNEAVLSVLAGLPFKYRRLAVSEVPRSGDSNALLQRFELDAPAIVRAARELLG